MESRVAENLRAYSTYRSKQLEKIIVGLPAAAEYSSTFHSVTLITSVICIVAIYAQVRAMTLFSLHPTCMIIGCFMFLSEGIVAYHNRSLLDTLSPIMQHSKKTKVSLISGSIVEIFWCLLTYYHRRNDLIGAHTTSSNSDDRFYFPLPRSPVYRCE